MSAQMILEGEDEMATLAGGHGKPVYHSLADVPPAW
jgi:hypothetical protein